MVNTKDDIRLQNYQDDFDTSDDMSDPMMDELEDDPVKGFGVPVEEFKRELDDLAIDEELLPGNEDKNFEDARERIEDLDEDPEQAR